MEEIEGFRSNSAVGVEQKHAAMLERLSNRHQSRLAARSETGDSVGSTQSFLSQFSQSKHSIGTRISRVRELPDQTQKPDLEAISQEISALEKLIAESSYSLPAYEVRSCLDAISQLKQSLDSVTSLAIPRKKFSFKNKLSRKPATEIAANVPTPIESQKKNLDVGSKRSLIAAPGFRNRENEVLVNEFSASETNCGNGEFILSDLRNCEVRLKGCLRALFIDKLINCKVYCGVVMGSILIEEAEGCIFVTASHQIRIHNAKKCDFYLRVRSRPIIEDCNEVRFSPYCLSYEGLKKQLSEANLDEESGNWANVDDFKWLKAVKSPNWSFLPQNERIETIDITN